MLADTGAGEDKDRAVSDPHQRRVAIVGAGLAGATCE
jgi:hypothetical protein